MSHKNKLQARKLTDFEDRLNELTKNNEELTQENSKMMLQSDEMRSVYRQKLMQFMSDHARGGGSIKSLEYSITL